jgi:hypothetical protein
VVHLSLTPSRSEDWLRIDHSYIQTHIWALLSLTPITGIIDCPFSTLTAPADLRLFNYVCSLFITSIDQQLHQIAKAKHRHIFCWLCITLPIEPKASEPQ